MTNLASKPDIDTARRYGFFLLIAVVTIAPLATTGLSSLITTTLQATSLVLLISLLWTRSRLALPRHIVVAVIAILLLPAIYLIPLPEYFSSLLPGRSLLETPLPQWDLNTASVFLSVVPTETTAAWLTLIPAAAVFLSVSTLTDQQLSRCLQLIIIFAVLQSLLSLTQYGSGKESALYLGMEHAHFGSGVGTYTNRNHLAGFLNMVIPLTLALLAKFLVDFNRTLHGRDSMIARFTFFGSSKGITGVALAGAFVLFLVAVIFSRSRAGIAICVLSILLSMFVFAAGSVDRKRIRAFVFLFLAALSLALIIGVEPVLDRFSASDPLTDGRWTIFSGSIDAIQRFFPVGAGPGTFDEIYPPHQEVVHGRWIINHAHNDYLEWIVETGVFGLALILFGLGAYLAQWKRVWPRGLRWSKANYIQIAAGISVLSILVHSGVDYNLRTPANAVFFAFFAGIFYRRAKSSKSLPDDKPRTRRRRETSDFQSQADAKKRDNTAESQITNPFLGNGKP